MAAICGLLAGLISGRVYVDGISTAVNRVSSAIHRVRVATAIDIVSAKVPVAAIDVRISVRIVAIAISGIAVYECVAVGNVGVPVVDDCATVPPGAPGIPSPTATSSRHCGSHRHSDAK